MATGRRLSIPRGGSAILTRKDGKETPKEMGNTIAAWQTEERDAPKRIVVRTDGQLKDQLDEDKNAGFPCAVLRIDYSSGGLEKSVLIDPHGQSALTLWCNSCEVTPIWDARRIERIANFYTPARQQLLAATINTDAEDGDTGAADARWIDAIRVDAETGNDGSTTEWSIHPIPEGARGVRFLDTLVNGAMTSVPGLTTIIAWSADTFSNYPKGAVQFNTNGATDTSILIVPTVARFLFLAFPISTISTFDVPSFIEWIMSPNTLPGF